MPAGADVVTEWNSAALDSTRATSMPPPRASRALAILHAAIYDAVNGIARTHDTYLVHGIVPASASMDAAASSAAHRVLVTLFPARESIFSAVHRQIVMRIPDGPKKSSGLIWGHLVGDGLLAARANDGSDDSVAPPVRGEPQLGAYTAGIRSRTRCRSGDLSDPLRSST